MYDLAGKLLLLYFYIDYQINCCRPTKMFTLGQEHILEEASKPQPIMFTAGAVPVKNRKGKNNQLLRSMTQYECKLFTPGSYDYRP